MVKNLSSSLFHSLLYKTKIDWLAKNNGDLNFVVVGNVAKFFTDKEIKFIKTQKEGRKERKKGRN